MRIINEAFGNRMALPYCTRSFDGQLLRASAVIAPIAIALSLVFHIVGQHDFGNAIAMSWFWIVPLVALWFDLG